MFCTIFHGNQNNKIMFEGLIQSLLWFVTSPDYLASPLLSRRGVIILRLLGTLTLPVATLRAASTLVPASVMGVAVAVSSFSGLGPGPAGYFFMCVLTFPLGQQQVE